MQHEFWHQRWEQNQIAFHKQDINPYLQRYWPRLSANPGGRVLIPLCGKTNDMIWLRAMGYEVIGVELSQLAVEAFFVENGLQPQIRIQGDFQVYEVDGLQIFCGDCFALRAADLGDIDAVYDRGALVALPPEMRVEYVSGLYAMLSANVEILLISFAYPQQDMPGPPFSVERQEIDSLYGHWCNIELLATENALETESQFKQRGLTRMLEQTYRLVVR